MKLSIVIPAKNEASGLPALLEAIRAQAVGVEHEVIVADAGSTDDTRAIAERYGALVVDGGLPGPGRNAGAKRATGEWICFHDADMLPLGERFYERVLNGLAARGADYGTARLVPDTKTVVDRFFHWAYNTHVWLTSRFAPHAQGGTFFVKRAWHERSGGFDETVVFAEDMEYAYRLHRLGAKFAYLNDVAIQISTRRLKKDGHANIARRYVYAEFYMRLVGPIRKELFPYSFDHSKTAKSA